MGGFSQANLNFSYKWKQDEETVITIYPLLLAVAKGSLEIIQMMILNKGLDLSVRDSYSGVNSFWLACYYGRGLIMKELANAGIDIYNTNNENIDVLHLSIYLNRP